MYGIGINHDLEFQFQYGSIGSSIHEHSNGRNVNGFNSSMVRLGENCESIEVLCSEFQFQYGSIGRSFATLFNKF